MRPRTLLEKGKWLLNLAWALMVVGVISRNLFPMIALAMALLMNDNLCLRNYVD